MVALDMFPGRELLYAVDKYQTVVLVGETGCGKSTRASLQRGCLVLHPTPQLTA